MVNCPLVLGVGLWLFVAASSQELTKNLIPNGGFETDTDGDGMADGWRFSGDRGVTVTWSRDEGPEGQYSQKLHCTAFERLSPASHVMLALNDGFPLREGQWYKLSFQVKGEGIPGSAAQVAIQQTGPWENLGCEKEFRVGPQWRTVETVFRARKSIESNLRLQIWFTGTGTIWIDDVRMVTTEPVRRRYTDVLPDLGAKNMVPNASFECGASGWGSITTVPGWGGNLNSLIGEVDSSVARHHGHSLRIAVDRATTPVIYFDYFEMLRQPVLMPLAANRGWINVTPGAHYTLSAYVRAEPARTPFKLRVHQAFGGYQDHDIEAGEEWARVTFTFQPARDQIFIALGPDLTRSELPRATVWIDGVQLEAGAAATEFELRAPVEIGLEWPAAGHLFSPGEARCGLLAFNGGPQARTVTIRTEVTDFMDRTASSQSTMLRLRPGAAARKVLRLDPKCKGFFRLALSSEDGVLVPTRPERFAIIPQYHDTDSLFGMNHAYPTQELNALCKQFGLTWFRDWSLKWQHVEPEKGRFDFVEADHQINRVLDLGLNVLPLLPFPSSDWASSAPETVKSGGNYPASRERAAWMPRDTAEFANYVRTTVEHYKDRLHVWEILNEPIYTSYALPRDRGYTPAAYVRLLAVAYAAVKETDPTAFVIGGIAGQPDTYTREFIDAAGLKYVDALNLHVYPGIQAPEGYIQPLRKLRQMMAEAGAVKPIWFTEGAYYADDDLPWEPFEAWMTPVEDELFCSALQVRFNAILLAFGVEKIIYHSGTPGELNDDEIAGIFFEWDGAPRKMVAAQAQLAAMLGPDTKTIGLLGEDPWVCAFHSRGKTVVILWSNRGERLTSAPTESARLLDLCGNEIAGDTRIGDIPHYLVVDRLLTADQAKALLAQLLRVDKPGTPRL